MMSLSCDALNIAETNIRCAQLHTTLQIPYTMKLSRISLFFVPPQKFYA